MEQNKPKLFREYFTLGIEERCEHCVLINGLPFGCQKPTTEMVHYNGFRFVNYKVELTTKQLCTIIAICDKCKQVLEKEILAMENKLEKSNE